MSGTARAEQPDPGRVPLSDVRSGLGDLGAGERGNAESGYVRGVKLLLDLVFSWSLFFALLVPGLVIALLVKLDSRGPAFYSQERVGRGGRPFSMFKFRSMVVGAASRGRGVLVEKDDPRVTRMGKILRKTSLDELPQLFNIMRGEMSVIGPRPGLRFQVEQYTPEQRRRLLVLPGITGWAQIHGRNSIPWDERIRYDVDYVDRVSLRLDAVILARTFGVVFRGSDQLAPRAHFKPRAGDGYADRPPDGADDSSVADRARDGE